MNHFCHQCGNRVGKGDSFCEHCGTEIGHDVATSRKEMRPVYELEGKAWYRAVKVTYLLVVCICVLSTIGIAYGVMPERQIDGDKSLIACNNGNVYAPSDNSIFIYGDELSSYQDEHARILCKHNSTAYYSYSEHIPLNYTFKPVYIMPDYASWFGGVLLAIAIQAGVLMLLRIAFFYITLGKKPTISPFSF